MKKTASGGSNRLIDFLAGFCRDHPLDEKIFVVPSFIAGRQIGERLVRAAAGWVNLRFVTLPVLAQEKAALELLRLGARLSTEAERLALVDGLFREFKERGRWEYFTRLESSPGVARALLRAVTDLRSEGLTAESLDPALFAVASKGRDMAALLRAYERSLAEANAIDLAGLFGVAGQAAAGDVRPEPPLLLIAADTVLRRVERDFLDSVSGGMAVPVPRDPVFGLERPRLFLAGAGPEPPGAAPQAASSDAERLPWLFAPGKSPQPVGDGTVDFFRAVGPMNECREILRRVMGGGVPFDEVEIVCPADGIYPACLHDAAVRAGIPLTFADGLPMAFTTPGRVFAGLADWIEGGFPASALCALVESGDLRLPFSGPGEDLPPQSIARHLRNALIGWGRDRYVARLEARRLAVEAKLRQERTGDDEEIDEDLRLQLREEAHGLAMVSRAVDAFIGLIPEMPVTGSVAFRDLCEGLARLAETCSVIRPDVEDTDAKARALVAGELRDLARGPWAEASAGSGGYAGLQLEAALDRLRAAVSLLSVGASAPRPGHIHVSSGSWGGLSGRSATFVVGLDDAGFPGRGLQDPVLLDTERSRISPSLPTTADHLRTKLYAMASMLAALRGRVNLSYSAWSVLEDRPAAPSSLLLQVHRLLSGDETRDYAALDAAMGDAARRGLRPDPTGFLPGEPAVAIDDTDWWMARLIGAAGDPACASAVRKHFPSLGDGLRADEARNSERLGAYEGVVHIDRGRFDPLTNHGLEMSASRLESLVKCPFGYFLRRVLDVEPPDELELDRSRWLDPKDRGSLIHEILCEFMTRVTAAGERVEEGRHAPLMGGIAAERIAEWRREVPPPSEGIFAKERQDIMEALAIFLRVESGRPAELEPLVFEKTFSGVPIAVPGGHFLLKGVIDRIDRTGPETFRILDYKTGSPRPYEDLVAFGRGRVIQHALYAVAAEKLLAGEGIAAHPRVTESGYSFPTRRGEGGEVIVPEFDRKTFGSLLASILALIRNGYFVALDKEACRYCDFAPVCAGDPDRTKSKLETNPAVAVALEKVRSYE